MGFDELLSQQKQRKNTKNKRAVDEARLPSKLTKRSPRERKVPVIVVAKENRKKAVPQALRAEPVIAVTLGAPDPVPLALMYALLGFGLVMVYSASAIYADRTLHDANALIRAQLLHAVPAAIAAWLIGHYGDYRWLRRFTYPFLLITLAMLAATVAGWGTKAGGAARWLSFFGLFRVQPAEIAKLAVICWLADSLAKKRENIHTLSIGFLPHALGTGLMFLLCMAQPDFGSAFMIGLLFFVMLIIAGAPLGYILISFAALAGVGRLVIQHSPYRMARITAYLAQYAPVEVFKADNYQLFESQLSFGAGGIFGVGLGNSHQKLMYLPEAHTDFISSIVAEELGLIGFGALVLVFTYLVYRGVRTGLSCPDLYGSYLCLGIAFFIGMQAFMNFAVAVGVVPTKGLVLPFISFGGSSLVVNCCAVGLLTNVSRLQRADARVSPAPRTSSALRAVGGVS
jgi:cell division protein FtsW